MNEISKITKISAKKSFNLLRLNWPYKCSFVDFEKITKNKKRPSEGLFPDKVFKLVRSFFNWFNLKKNK